MVYLANYNLSKCQAELRYKGEMKKKKKKMEYSGIMSGSFYRR